MKKQEHVVGDDERCCRCLTKDELALYDGAQWLCYECSEATGFRTNFTPDAQAFKEIQKIV